MLAAHSGLDWIVIDMEHAPNDLSSVLHQLHASQPGPAETVVRVPAPDQPALVKTLLDTGVRSILFPMVESASAAAACVAATRYPPDGIRGVMTTARMSGYATDPEALQEYYRGAADEICVLVQVESPAAVAAIPEVSRSARSATGATTLTPVRLPARLPLFRASTAYSSDRPTLRLRWGSSGRWVTRKCSRRCARQSPRAKLLVFPLGASRATRRLAVRCWTSTAQALSRWVPTSCCLRAECARWQARSSDKTRRSVGHRGHRPAHTRSRCETESLTLSRVSLQRLTSAACKYTRVR